METEILDDNNYSKIRNVQYANFGLRFGATILDFLITIIPTGALVYMGYQNKSLMFFLISALIGMLYKPVMEGIWGATLGKMIVNISVVDSDLEKIDLGQSFLKNAIYIINSVIGIMGQFWLTGTEAFQEAEDLQEAMMAGAENPYTMITYIWLAVILISCFSMLASSLKQTLHDQLANTYCVHNSTFEQ
ncbi:MAG: RDD family protein [Saprospiraceae bacterium]|nr:RDD family protein [Saprospiraceae bacterium]